MGKGIKIACNDFIYNKTQLMGLHSSINKNRNQLGTVKKIIGTS